MNHSHPQKTYELKVSFPAEQSAKPEETKELVKAYLFEIDVKEFVEGMVDNLDIDHDYDADGRDLYAEVGGDASALHIYKYDQEYIVDVAHRLSAKFSGLIALEILDFETSEWMEGWKESFKPIYTNKICVFPPWEKDNIESREILIEIEPGMAFGTGQHATTQLCLQAIDDVVENKLCQLNRLADVGTGTGILAIAAAKLGFKELYATDIDVDAVRASTDNFVSNGVKIGIECGSVPVWEHKTYDLVVANILAVVLKKIIPELVQICEPGGLVLLSGVLADEKHELLELAEALELKIEKIEEMQDWCSLLLRKPAHV